MYLQRLSIFDYANNKYYVPNGDFNTKSSTNSLQMPNCTMYAYLRANEALEAISRTKGIARAGSTGFGNAKTWYEETGYPTGTELKEGSIAVFDGNCGHVAFVEKKIDSTHAIISESQYDDDKSLRNYKFFRSRQVELVVGKATLSGVGKLKGFIYLPVDDVRTDRNLLNDQVDVTKDYLRVRDAAGGATVSSGLYCPVGLYNVLETKEAELNGTNYTWYKLEDGFWIAHIEGETLYYPKQSDSTKDEEIKRLKKSLSEIKVYIEKVLEE